MRRRKPLGWPRYMVEKRLKSGMIAYYWSPPTWAKDAGCTLDAEALGTDYAEAKKRCDELLNPLLDAWREEDVVVGGPERGTFSWLIVTYRTSRNYENLKSKREYDNGLELVRSYRLAKDAFGRRLGDIELLALRRHVIQRVYDRLIYKEDGTKRAAHINRVMRYCRTAWNVVQRGHPDDVPSENPFSGLDLEKVATAGGAKPATREHLIEFIKVADRMGLSSVGTAAMLAFEWLVREVDLVQNFAWSDYRSEDYPGYVNIRHGKTGENVLLPLTGADGCLLYPELEARLSTTPRLGELVIMRDQPDRKSGAFEPFKVDWFRHRVTKIRREGGLPEWLTFASFRKGGMTELGDAGLTDQQILSLSGHRTRQMVDVYSRKTKAQRIAAASKRLAHRDGVDGRPAATAFVGMTGQNLVGMGRRGLGRNKPISLKLRGKGVVPRGGIEPPTRGFSDD